MINKTMQKLTVILFATTAINSCVFGKLLANTGVDRESGSGTVKKKEPDKAYGEKDNNSDKIESQVSDRLSSSKNNVYNREDEIIVTGSLIRGIGSSAGAQPITIDKSDITASGYATVQQALQALPQIFTGSITDHVNSTSASGIQNMTAGSAPDLRGLGPKATLYLVNGRRIPSTHIDTSTIDISSLPLVAIERIEVLPDGASAVYGSDAVAGVLNVILNRKYDGLETNFRYGTTAQGNTDEFSVSQAAGTSWSSGNIIIAYEYFRRGNIHYDERKYSHSDDLRKLGGTDHRVLASSPGNIANIFTFSVDYQIPSNQNGRGLGPADLLTGPPNLSSAIENTDLSPRQRRHSVFISVNQNVIDEFNIFLEGRYGNRNVKNYSGSPVSILFITEQHPFFVDAYGSNQPYYVFYNFTNDLSPIEQRAKINSYNAVIGFEYDFLEKFQLRSYANYSKEKTKTTRLNDVNSLRLMESLEFEDRNAVFNPYGDGGDNNPTTLDFITPPVIYQTNADITEFSAIIDGSVMEMTGGYVRLALGTSYRTDKIKHNLAGSRRQFERDVYAAFSELFLPVISEENKSEGLESLEVSLSARFERYSDQPIEPKELAYAKESSFNPKFGIRWEVVPGLYARSSLGTSFAMPTLQNRIASTSVTALPLADPLSPRGSSNVLVLNGTAPELENETATTWSVGLSVAPPSWSGARFSIGYFLIKFRDQITDILVTSDILSREGEFGDVITRDPTPATVLSACSEVDNPLLSPFECQNPDLVDVLIDARTRNQARTKINGIDIDAQLSIQVSSSDQVLASLSATYLINNRFKFTKDSRSIERLNTYGFPIDLRVRAGFAWSNSSGLSSLLSINYQDDYRGPFVAGRYTNIDSWTTYDLSITYDSDQSNHKAFLDKTSVTLSCLNLFNKNPPFVDISGGFDASNSNILGRFISINISKKW